MKVYFTFVKIYMRKITTWLFAKGYNPSDRKTL